MTTGYDEGPSRFAAGGLRSHDAHHSGQRPRVVPVQRRKEGFDSCVRSGKRHWEGFLRNKTYSETGASGSRFSQNTISVSTGLNLPKVGDPGETRRDVLRESTRGIGPPRGLPGGAARDTSHGHGVRVRSDEKKMKNVSICDKQQRQNKTKQNDLSL